MALVLLVFSSSFRRGVGTSDGHAENWADSNISESGSTES